MSTTSRGNHAQDHARLILERDGWWVETCVPQVRVHWSREKNDYVRRPQHDFYGLFDVIALKPDDVRLIQVTHPSGTSERKRKIRESLPPGFTQSPTIIAQVWEFMGSSFKVHELDGDAWHVGMEVVA